MRSHLGLSFLLVAAACGGDGASADDRALAALVPSQAVAWLRVASIEDLLTPPREIVAAVGEDTQPLESTRVLAQLGGVAGDTQWIDRRRPLGFALVAAKASPPMVLCLVPANDAAKYAGSLQARDLAAVAHGSYVVVPLGGKYEKPATPSKLTGQPAACLASLHVDVAAVAANLGVPIGAGLSAFQAGVSKAMSAAGSGLDGEALAAAYVDAVRTMLASTSSFDLRADYRGGRLEFSGTLMAKEGSSMDGLSSPPIDFSKLEGSLPAKSSVELLIAADWAKLWPRLEPVMSALLDVYPAAVRDNLRALMSNYRQVYEQMGPILAAHGDLFGDKGLDLAMHFAPRDANALLASMESMMAKPEYAQSGATFTSVGKTSTDGATVHDYRVKIDVDKLLGPAAATPPQSNVRELVQQMFGADGLPLRLAAKGEHAVVAIGPPREEVVRSLSSPRGPWPEGMRSALQRVGDCNPMLFERFDFAAILRAVRKMPGFPGRAMPEPPADTTASLELWAGIRDREWRVGMAIDAIGLAKMTKAMRPR